MQPSGYRAGLAAALLGLALAPAGAQSVATTVSMSVEVDARDALRGIAHVHEQIPVSAGPLALVYPKWIPGHHSPTGPIVNVGGFAIRTGTAAVPWRRDLDDPYLIHLDVPAGTSRLDVSFDFFGTGVNGYDQTRFATSTIFTLNWNTVMVVPQVADYRSITIAPTVDLPGAGWQYATALTTVTRAGESVTFEPTTMEQLIDSPLDAGTVVRRWELGTIDGAPVDLVAFADTPDQLAASDATIAGLRAVVSQAAALYGARHFGHYTFLLTVSDLMPGYGVEHHQSSDDGSRGAFLTDADALIASADLLPHEFNHSWDGKYRRPADLATPNLQVPMHDDLLWVYEGMTQYYGDLLAERSGLRTPEQWRAKLAALYAALDSETGRQVRTLQDTADAAPVLYGSPSPFESARRDVDFYAEGELMWLEADQLIRRQSNGHKSLDDLARTFFGRTSTGPEVVPYDRDDVIAALQAVAPYDWRGFFAQRLGAIAAHPPDPFTSGGYRLVFRPVRSSYERAVETVRHSFNARYSLGLVGRDDGTVTDVVQSSVAAAAGVAPGAKLVAVNSVPVGSHVRSVLDPALTAAQTGTGTLRLLLLQGGTYREVTLAAHDGPRYPDLERVAGTPAGLDDTARPLRVRP